MSRLRNILFVIYLHLSIFSDTDFDMVDYIGRRHFIFLLIFCAVPRWQE